MLSQAPPDHHDPSVAAVSAALRHAGLTTGDIASHRAMVGPLLQRWSVRSTRGEHAWVDLPGSRQVEGMAPVPDPELGHLLAGLGDDTTVAALPTPLAGLGWAYPLDGPGELLVGLALRTAAAAEAEPGRVELAGRSLGGFLRRLHATPCRRRPAGPPPPVRRLATGAGAGALVDQHRWRRVLERWIDDPGHEASPLHGQLGLGHVLVTQPVGAGDTSRCVITGWSGFVTGRPAFDVGHLVGDLLEVAALVPSGAPGRPHLLAAAAAARAGYEDAGAAPLAPDFWATAASAACVKVLDHDLRLHQAFAGSHAQEGTDLAPIADALLDPSSELGRAFA